MPLKQVVVKLPVVETPGPLVQSIAQIILCCRPNNYFMA